MRGNRPGVASICIMILCFSFYQAVAGFLFELQLVDVVIHLVIYMQFGHFLHFYAVLLNQFCFKYVSLSDRLLIS